MRKSSYLLKDLRKFNEIFKKDVTYGNIKSHKKQDSNHSVEKKFPKYPPPPPPLPVFSELNILTNTLLRQLEA